MEYLFSEKPEWEPSDQLLSRLCDAYKLTSETYFQPDETMWGEIDKMKIDVHLALVANDKLKLRWLLMNPNDTNLYFGMDTLAKFNEPHMYNGSAFLDLLQNIIQDNLTSVFEVSGAQRFWNFENNPERPNIDVETSLSDLERLLGCEIHFPNPFPKEYGLSSSRGIIGHRVPMALYHALKIRELCLLTKGGKGNILEIGAGVGRSAYFSKIMGLGDYTIVDLPLSLIGQALFLSATLGDDAISLEGENDPGVEKKIRLISPKKLLESGEKFDVVMNVDSLSEMPMEQASAYLKYLSKYANVLYSMNHEGNQYRTIDIAAAVELNAAPIRHASAFRKGYVEELYFLGLSHTLGEREE